MIAWRVVVFPGSEYETNLLVYHGSFQTQPSLRSKKNALKAKVNKRADGILTLSIDIASNIPVYETTVQAKEDFVQD